MGKMRLPTVICCTEVPFKAGLNVIKYCIRTVKTILHASINEIEEK
jgi:hypothetical protein